MSILNEIKRNERYKDIWVDRDAIFKSLGIDLTERRYLSLSELSYAELDDLLMKSVMWMETVSELVSTAKRMRMDREAETDRLYNEALRRIDIKKATEAKAEAKSAPEYLASLRLFNTLYAYVDYLERLVTNLDKYHYAIKSKVDSNKNIERKY